MNITFNKESNGNWYVDLPDWKGSKADLQMVAGADSMLDMLSEGSNKVECYFSTTPFKGNEVIRLTELLTEGMGANYILEMYKGINLNLNMWLCDVTKFVFGHFPVNIYFVKHESIL